MRKAKCKGPVEVREAKNTSSALIATLQENETLNLRARTRGDDGNDWFEIQLPDGLGYALASSPIDEPASVVQRTIGYAVGLSVVLGFLGLMGWFHSGGAGPLGKFIADLAALALGIVGARGAFAAKMDK